MTERTNEGTTRMSDAAQPPQSPENLPAEGTGPEGTPAGEGSANGSAARVPLDKSPAASAPAAGGGTPAPGPEFDPWAPPAENSPGTGSDGAGTTLFWDDAGTTPPPPSVHSHPTVTSAPATPPPGSAPQAAQTWANPFAPPGAPVAGVPQDNPFAPPAPHGSYAQPAAPGEPVPPPPIAPDGPGHAPYSYPSGPGYGYPQQPGHVGGGPVYSPPPDYRGAPGYGWAPMAPQPSNGMGTASLVVGIVSAVVFCLWPLAIILGILAVIFGVIGRGKARKGEATNSGQALAGIICGGVGIVVAAAFGVIVIAFDDSGSSTSDDGYSTSSLSSSVSQGF
ncbi:DUF4190 domain-containing protein [Streptomyces geranii]|uniref:DUF4190 domain-containing protein n=1 Tax=Streptomyces geranii TaxID=2058923 RepID=UPI001E3EFFB0|nr:DUF4190 domain-containing protein [Streptomyces geranii]